MQGNDNSKTGAWWKKVRKAKPPKGDKVSPRPGSADPTTAGYPLTQIQIPKPIKVAAQDSLVQPSRSGPSRIPNSVHRASIVNDRELAERNTTMAEDKRAVKLPPKSYDIRLSSSSILEEPWDRYENAQKDEKHVGLVEDISASSGRAHVTIFRLRINTGSASKGGKAELDLHDMFVVWSEKEKSEAAGTAVDDRQAPSRKGKEVATTNARPKKTGQVPKYVSYFSHWEEGVLLALIRRGVKTPRVEKEVIPFMPSKNMHAIITFDPDEWIVYRQCVDFGPAYFPSIMPIRYIKSIFDLFLTVNVIDDEQETLWYNPDDLTSSFEPDALFEGTKSRFVMDEMQCYANRLLRKGSYSYSVFRLLDLVSDLEVTTFLCEDGGERKMMCYRADPGALLVLINREYSEVAYVMKPSTPTQRIVCRFQPDHWDISSVAPSSKRLWERASRYPEGPDKECKIMQNLEFDKFIVPDSEGIRVKPQHEPASRTPRPSTDSSIHLPIQGTGNDY